MFKAIILAGFIILSVKVFSDLAASRASIPVQTISGDI